MARRADRLEDLAGKLRADGHEAHVLTADLTDAASAQDAVERTVTRFGRLDTLVNAAGLMLGQP